MTMFKRIKSLLKFDIFYLGILLVLVLIQTRFLFNNGMYTFSDEPHFANLYEMIRGFQSGQFPPRWAPDMSYNYGHPLFNFYYPLPFYLGSFFFLVFNFSLIASLKTVFFLGVLFSGISFYFLSKKFFSNPTCLAISLLYLYTPYRAVDLYVRGAVGELWSFVFMPLGLLAFYNLIEKPNVKNLTFASLSLSGLILSHNLSAIIFLPILVFYCALVILIKKEKIVRLSWVLLSMIAGLVVSAFYWLPALVEKQFIKSGTPFNPFDHFPFIKQLLLPSWGYGASVWGPNDEMSFQIGIANMLVIIMALFAYFTFHHLSKSQKTLYFFCLAVFVFSVFLMNIRSWFLWQLLPLGDYIQFPWRLLMLTTLSSALLGGFTENIFFKNRFGKTAPLLIALIAILLTFNYFKPHKILKVEDNYYLDRFFVNRNINGQSENVSSEYQNYSEDYLPLTIWNLERPKSLPVSKIITIDGELSYIEKTPIKFEVEMETPTETKVVINNYYFPGWEILVDGIKTNIDIEKPYGNFSVFVPKGKHNLLVEFKNTSVRTIANIISLASLLGILGMSLFNKVKYFYGR